MELLKEKKEICVTDIYKLYPSVSMSTISTTITNLWKKKLVMRNTSTNNLRLTLVRLTIVGEKTLKEVRRIQCSTYSTLIDALDLDEKENDIFTNVLIRAIDHFDNELFTTKS